MRSFLKWVCIILVLLLVLCLLNTQSIIRFIAFSPTGNAVIKQGNTRQLNPWNIHAVDSGIRLLQNGDMVLRTGSDMTSNVLRQLNRNNKTYSHCGIVLVENGYPFVYHCIGGEDNPDERLRRDSAQRFFSPISNLGFGIVRFNFTKEEITNLTTITRAYYQQRPKFDMDFDLTTDDKLYCAEFLYKAIRQATNDTSYISLTHFMGRTYVGVDNLFENPHVKRICEIRYK